MYVFFPAGGIGKYTHQALQAFVRLPGMQVELACPPDYHWQHDSGYKVWPGLFRISAKNALVRKLRFVLGQFISPPRALHHAQKSSAQLLHMANINYLSFPFWRGTLDRWGGTLVCTAHDVQRGRYIVSKRWGQKQLRAFYRRCDAVLVHSQEQKAELQTFAGVDPARVHVVAHGSGRFGQAAPGSAARLREHYNIKPGRRVALFFGYLRPEKNLDGLLRALALLLGEQLHLVVAGNQVPGGAGHVQQCRALIEQLGLQARVTLDVRYLCEEEIPDLLELCDWLVLPYKSSFSSQSGVLNLAAHYRKPVLATPSPTIARALHDTPIGRVCNGFTPADIAQGIEAIQADVAQGRDWEFDEYLECNSWQRNALQTAQVYQQLLGGKSA